MKKLAISFFKVLPLMFVFLLLSSNSIFAQVDSTETKNEMKVVEKNDGTQYVGVILKDDGREILIRTKDLGELYIPKHEIARIEAYNAKDFRNGEFVGEDLFATRYVFTTNGLPMKKGESYVLLNLWGPDFQFGVADNFGIGVMTTWIGAPLIVSAKGTIPLGENLGLGLGALAGWGGPWNFVNTGLSSSVGALPFASLTTGDRRNNFTINAGYLAVGYPSSNCNVDPNTGQWVCSSGRDIYDTPMFGLAGMAKVSKRTSFVFDSFILPVAVNNGITVVAMPGFRFQSKDRLGERAFGFNLTIVYADGTFVPVPIPSFTWFVKL